MTAYAVHDARELGYELAVLRAAQAARGIYLELGFREHCTFSRYVKGRRR
jgi:hypothetical protein